MHGSQSQLFSRKWSVSIYQLLLQRPVCISRFYFLHYIMDKSFYLEFISINYCFIRYVGATQKRFYNNSDRSKRRKVHNIKSSSSAAELALATSLSLKEEGNSAGAQLIMEITTTTPTRAKIVLSKLWKKEEMHSEMSPEEARSLIITTELTKNQYNSLRSSALSYGHNLYPSYKWVLNVKRAPLSEEIIII